MIIREWRGRSGIEGRGRYPAYFREHVVPALRKVAGFEGADLLSHEHGEVVEFTVLSRWTSMAAIRAFAGEDPTLAVVEPGAISSLSEFDKRVVHHELVQHLSV